MTDYEKAKKEMDEAVHEVVDKVGPAVRLIGSVLKDTLQALQPLFADFNESAKKVRAASEKLRQAKQTVEEPYDAKAHSERYP